MPKSAEDANKALVLEAFDTLFDKRDYKAAEHYWSSNFLQHSAHIPPGRDGHAGGQARGADCAGLRQVQ
jgi:predicted SnoaL-like aldol condensation-catalyzing enzyme